MLSRVLVPRDIRDASAPRASSGVGARGSPRDQVSERREVVGAVRRRRVGANTLPLRARWSSCRPRRRRHLSVRRCRVPGACQRDSARPGQAVSTEPAPSATPGCGLRGRVRHVRSRLARAMTHTSCPATEPALARQTTPVSRACRSWCQTWPVLLRAARAAASIAICRLQSLHAELANRDRRALGFVSAAFEMREHQSRHELMRPRRRSPTQTHMSKGRRRSVPTRHCGIVGNRSMHVGDGQRQRTPRGGGAVRPDGGRFFRTHRARDQHTRVRGARAVSILSSSDNPAAGTASIDDAPPTIGPGGLRATDSPRQATRAARSLTTALGEGCARRTIQCARDSPSNAGATIPRRRHAAPGALGFTQRRRHQPRSLPAATT